MPKVRDLTEGERGIVWGQVEAGIRQRIIAQNMGISQSAVSKIATKYRNHNTLKNLPRSGSPPVTSPRENRAMTRLAARLRFITGSFVFQNLFKRS